MVIARIPKTTHDAPAKTVAAAAAAHADGYRHVYTGYDPGLRAHTVHADEPGVAHPRNTNTPGQ